jgi:xylulose-5-phosphate/fructose-6-phosphate phosphoketolase
LKILEEWMRSYRPEELFDEQGCFISELAALAPKGDRRMGANPHANGGKLLVDLDVPNFTDYAIEVEKPAVQHYEATRQLGKLMRDIFTRNAAQQNFRISPGESHGGPERTSL